MLPHFYQPEAESASATVSTTLRFIFFTELLTLLFPGAIAQFAFQVREDAEARDRQRRDVPFSSRFVTLAF